MEMHSPDNLDQLKPDDAILAEQAFPGWRALCPESFMYVSRNSYPLPWLVRELVQNYTDPNPDSPGTLNGVETTLERLQDGSSRFTISGRWPFPEYGKLVSFSTGKLQTDTKNAGGNGIGLKQAVLRFMRDLGITRFTIIGEGWEVNYRMVNAESINASLEAQDNPHRATEGSLMVQAQPSSNTGSCHYIIETTNQEVTDELSRFKQLGVCDENECLQGMDYSNKFGSLKWMPITKDGDKKEKAVHGRLFLNGQIFRFQNRDEESSDFWGGMEGIALQLNQADYQMSIDRPPLTNYALCSLAEQIVDKMSRDEAIENLKLSEHLWTTLSEGEYSFDTPFCLILIEKIINSLWYADFSRADYDQVFGDKKYLCLDKKLADEQKSDLEAKAYTICPKFFGKIHMPKASAQLNSLEFANTKPDPEAVKKSLFKASTESGARVPHQKVKVKSAKELGQYIQSKLGDRIENVEISPDDPGTIRVILSGDFDKLQSITAGDAELHPLRGVAYNGLSRGVIRNIHMAQGEYFTVFIVSDDNLIIRNIEASADTPYIDITPEEKHFNALLEGLTQSRMSRALDLTERIPSLRTPGYVMATVAAAVLVIVAARPLLPQPNNSGGNQDITPLISKQNQADVAPTLTPDSIMLSLQAFFQRLSDSIGERVEDLPPGSTIEKIENPSERQLKKLELLKEYFFLTTGIRCSEGFYVFRGTGTLGINHGKQTIGIHEELLESSFEEALSTFSHEMAHSDPVARGHDLRFIRAMDAFAGERENTLADIARTPADKRTPHQKRILQVELDWDAL